MAIPLRLFMLCIPRCAMWRRNASAWSLGKLLCGQAAAEILRQYPDVLHAVLPETQAMFGFEQHSPYHRYDVWEHTLHALKAAETEETLRWAVLLHDTGKPEAFTLDDAGTGHAYGHAKISRDKAESAMARLKMDRATWEDVTTLVERHDIPLPPDRRTMKRRLRQLGERRLRLLIQLQRADALGTGTRVPQEVEQMTQERTQTLKTLLAEDACVSLRQLQVNGRDLLAAGIPAGKILGQTLERLLEEVMEETLPNQREPLLHRAAELVREGGTHGQME